MRPSTASTTSPLSARNRGGGFFRGRGFLTLLLGIAFLWSLTSLQWGSSPVHPGGLASIGKFFQAAVSPELSGEFLSLALSSAWKTIAYAVAGICLAVAWVSHWASLHPVFWPAAHARKFPALPGSDFSSEPCAPFTN